MASFVAAPWSCTRSPISRASSIVRSAWLTPWPASPHAGATSACERSRDGSQPRRVSSHHTSSSVLPDRRRVLADRTVRWDRAPDHPAAAVEEAGERHRVVEVERADVEVHEAGPGVEREPQVAPTAHVHGREARGRGQRGREDVGGELAVERGGTGVPAHERGLVETEQRARRREGGSRRALRSPRAHARAVRAAERERASTGTPASTSATPSVSGPAHCTFTRFGGFGQRGGDVEEREEAAVRERIERRDRSRRSRRATSAGKASRRPRSARRRSARAHCATNPSSGVRIGSCGAAGSSGRQRNTSAAAAPAS